MANSDALNHHASRSFVLWWVLANMAGLPILLDLYSIGYLLIGLSLTLGLAVLSDGTSVGYVAHIIVAIILALSGAIIGGWLGLMQWLVLRKQLPHAGRWILASSLGVSVGAPLSWLVFSGMIPFIPIGNHSDAGNIYLYAYICFDLIIGLSIGVSQWLILRQWVYKAEWWIVAIPICFALDMVLTHFPVSGPFSILGALTALVGIGLITGILLNWLLRFHKKQEVNEKSAAVTEPS